MDKLRALRYFLAVAETSNFRNAAKILSVPASSVSRRISDLENELKIELFHRSTRVVTLSALGQVYYEQVKEIVTALDHADDLVAQRSGSPSGPIKITVMTSYARARLLPATEKLCKRYPDIVLDIEVSDQLTDFSLGKVDIAIRASSDLPERAVAKKISENQFILLAAPSYLLQHGTPLKADDLLKHRSLLYRGPNGVLDWQANTNGIWRALKTKPALVSNDSEALKRAALSGQGIALAPNWAAQDALDRGDLKEITLQDDLVSVTRAPNAGIFLLYQKTRYSVQKIKAAVDFLVAELSPSAAPPS